MKKEWRKQHWEELKLLAGNWIGFDKESGEILESDVSLSNLIPRLRKRGNAYILHFVNPLDVFEPQIVRL